MAEDLSRKVIFRFESNRRRGGVEWNDEFVWRNQSHQTLLPTLTRPFFPEMGLLACGIARSVIANRLAKEFRIRLFFESCVL